MAARAAAPHVADRGGDRRVLRRAQGDPAGHHRHVPGDDHARRGGVYQHLELFDARDWGLIIYDEVHLLPAPIFRMTADLQSRRRLGLTATLVREDGREGDVFSLIGPKRYDAPWKDIEAQGWIAPADCIEVRVTLTDAERLVVRDRRARGAVPDRRHRAHQDAGGAASSSSSHPGEPTLVIGQYLDQLDELGERLGRPVIQGATTDRGARAAVRRLPAGEITLLVVSQGRELLHRPARGHGGDPGVRAPSAPGRRRRSGSAGCCDPRTTGGRRTSTRWSRATPWTPTTPPPAAVPGRAGLRLPIVDADDLLANEDF